MPRGNSPDLAAPRMSGLEDERCWGCFPGSVLDPGCLRATGCGELGPESPALTLASF